VHIRKRASSEQTVHPVIASSSTNLANGFSSISLKSTDDPNYKRHVTAVVMTKLLDTSTASVAVDVVTLIGCKPEVMVKFS